MTSVRRHPTVKMSLEVLDDLVLVVTVRAPGGDAVRWLERQILALPASNTASYMQVVLPSPSTVIEVPDADRRAMLHFAQACQPRLQGAAFVVLIDGFFGATVRSVLAAVTMVARPRVPVKVLGSVDEGARWLAQATPSSLPPTPQIIEHVARMASAMGLSFNRS